jgi:branched-chain amino acid transport system ATP-binding protein
MSNHATAQVEEIASAARGLLAVEDLKVRYGQINALNGASIHVGQGEVVAIVGPNGAGKSSLLGAIAGIVKPVGGTIAFDGENIVGQPLERTVRRGIALVPEGRHVFSGLTVLENLKLGATIRSSAAEVDAEIQSYFEIFPILSERRREVAGRLSGGEQQMLVIARALLSNPKLLMLDEPSLGLAPKITDRIYEIIEDIRNRGVTVLVVEQNAGRALKAADRTYVLNGGIVRLSGPSSELENHSDFEAAYFGLSKRKDP